jgi:hypothetical protein
MDSACIGSIVEAAENPGQFYAVKVFFFQNDLVKTSGFGFASRVSLGGHWIAFRKEIYESAYVSYNMVKVLAVGQDKYYCLLSNIHISMVIQQLGFFISSLSYTSIVYTYSQWKFR